MLQKLHRFEENLLCTLLGLMTALVAVEVVLRFFFNTGLLWAQEVTLYISAWFVLLGASYGIRVGAHIGVDAFIRLMPPLPRKILSSIAVACCLIYCGLFIYGSWIYLAKMKLIELEMEDLPIPKWIAMSVLVIGFVLLAIRFLILLWNIITDKQDGFKLADEAKESLELAQKTDEEVKSEGVR
ncbi:TRAP transporter small permease [Pelagibaculum spongiae]|uniref:TRAP transporter small permease protein n=2 Tax=Pelagibaculum spongiae TaxID=2080658 RepID=A0A2V1H5R3_9GAMM|nr:TRAP transporter small permease [Pelagibaculum spongiae]